VVTLTSARLEFDESTNVLEFQVEEPPAGDDVATVTASSVEHDLSNVEGPRTGNQLSYSVDAVTGTIPTTAADFEVYSC